jgi:integrase
MILTGLRTDAVRRAEWSEFDLEAGLWTVPIAHLKDKKTRMESFRVPLSRRVAEILDELQRSATGNFVFPGLNTKTPISNMAMLSLLKRMNRDDDGCAIWQDPRDGRPVVPHGFRASLRTWAEEQTSFPHAVIEQAMGHQVGTEVERAYRRTDVFDKRRQLMDAWANYCSKVPSSIGPRAIIEFPGPRPPGEIRPSKSAQPARG